MTDTGLLYGAAVAYTRYRQVGYFRLEGRFSTGEMEYDGSLLNGTPYRHEGDRYCLADVRMLWGRGRRVGTPESPFSIGLGYRYLRDIPADPAAYLRQSNYLYLPVGMERYYRMGDSHWGIGWGGEIDILLFGLKSLQRQGGFYHKPANTRTRNTWLRGTAAQESIFGPGHSTIRPALVGESIDEIVGGLL